MTTVSRITQQSPLTLSRPTAVAGGRWVGARLAAVQAGLIFLP
jgi:hypothetical protein